MKFQTWVSILTLLSHHLNRAFKPLLHKDKRFYKQTSLVKIALGYPLQHYWASLVAQLVKNPPAMWETWIRSLGWEDPLEKRKATHSSILEILGIPENPMDCIVHGVTKSRTQLSDFHFSLSLQQK